MQLERTLGMFKAEKCKLCQRRSNFAGVRYWFSIYLTPLCYKTTDGNHNTLYSTKTVVSVITCATNFILGCFASRFLFSRSSYTGLNQRMSQPGVRTLSRDVKMTQPSMNSAGQPIGRQLHNFRRWTNQVWAPSLWSNQNESSSHVTPILSSQFCCEHAVKWLATKCSYRIYYYDINILLFTLARERSVFLTRLPIWRSKNYQLEKYRLQKEAESRKWLWKFFIFSS